MGTIEPGNNGENLKETANLISLAQEGDSRAFESLLNRYYPYLQNFLHNKLIPSAQYLEDTQDLVQEVLISAYPQIDRFEYRGIGSFWAYLRSIAINRVRKIWKQNLNDVQSEPLLHDSKGAPSSPDLGPVEMLKRKEEFEAYERAVDTLNPREREAFLMIMELGLPYQVIAAETTYPSPQAARMAVLRASRKVCKVLQNERK